MKTFKYLIIGLVAFICFSVNATQLLREPTLKNDLLVFTYANDIWKVSLKGGDATRVTSFQGQEFSPKISPDGNWIAFTGNYNGNNDVLPIPVPPPINIKRYFGALSGPQGQPITYELVDSCCPFPSGKNNMGAGLLDVYEVTWEGLSIPKRLHINLYERGEIIAPAGFGIKKIL